MNLFLILAFLFFIGSVFGWFLELFYRRFFSKANPDRKWINPGFCVGPYVPLYGSGLCILYLLALLEDHMTFEPLWVKRVILFVIMAVAMTVIEYIAGILVLKLANVRLWDYTKEWGNIQGLICPKFSVYWALLGSVYYFLIHPYILEALAWLAANLAFSFVVGLFFGVFIVDFCYSSKMLVHIRKFAVENELIVKFERLKADIRTQQEKANEKIHFVFPFLTNHPITETLHEMVDGLEDLADHFELMTKKHSKK